MHAEGFSLGPKERRGLLRIYEQDQDTGAVLLGRKMALLSGTDQISGGRDEKQGDSLGQ